jgi:ABC-type phosphate transport system substrate-binding protein
LLNQTVDFGASDAPMKDEALATAPGKILHIPIVAGGVAIIYNLPTQPETQIGRRHTRQHLSRQHHQVERSENCRAQSGRSPA